MPERVPRELSVRIADPRLFHKLAEEVVEILRRIRVQLPVEPHVVVVVVLGDVLGNSQNRSAGS